MKDGIKVATYGLNNLFPDYDCVRKKNDVFA